MTMGMGRPDRKIKPDTLARGYWWRPDPPKGQPELILIGTGSEVPLCLTAYEQLSTEGLQVRVGGIGSDRQITRPREVKLLSWVDI